MAQRTDANAEGAAETRAGGMAAAKAAGGGRSRDGGGWEGPGTTVAASVATATEVMCEEVAAARWLRWRWRHWEEQEKRTAVTAVAAVRGGTTAALTVLRLVGGGGARLRRRWR